MNHSELLKKVNINNDDLKTNINFDLTINLDSNKSYKTTLSLETPKGNVVEKGEVHQQITEMDDIVFKRIENV